MSKTLLDKYHYHEMLDRLSMVADMVETYCGNHPVAESDIRIRSLVDKALEDLYDAYQIAGELSMDEE
jgi:hypothetical protein